MQKYVRPKIECNCQVCDKELEYPYVHVSLEPTYFVKKDKNDPKVLHKDLDGSVIGYFCDQNCYRETL